MILPIEPFDSEAGKVTVTDILTHCIHMPVEKHGIGGAYMSVVRCLQHAGWKRRQIRTGPKARRWFYEGPE